MFHFFFLAHGALGWSDEILLAVVLAALVSFGMSIWYAGRAEQHKEAQPVQEPETLD